MGMALNLDERFMALQEQQARFVAQVYGTLAGVLGLCVATGFLFFSMPMLWPVTQWLGIVSLVLIIATWFVRISGPVGWALLVTFACCIGGSLGPAIGLLATNGMGHIVAMAGATTLGIFVGLSAFVWISGINFRFMYGFLMIGTLGLIICGLVLAFVPNADVSYFYCIAGAVLYSGWILFDTSAITEDYCLDNNIPGAVFHLFLDIVNLFLFLLQIFMASDD
jgi:FtsH-binding integral membrane protein